MNLPVEERDGDRVFTVQQKQVMAERQLFTCPACEEPLSSEVTVEHGHHIYPHSVGGITQLDNGLLLHPECHAKMAHESIWDGCRDWHVRELQRSMLKWRGTHVVQAVMGAGKTFFMLRFFQMRRGFIPHMIVVTPNNEVCDQVKAAARQMGITARTWEGNTKWPDGVGIYITTYQMIATGYSEKTNANAMRMRALIDSVGSDKAMTALDEVHHCGDGKTWADAIEHAIGHSRIKLCLSGTPWRHDNNRIPFAKYEDGVLQADAMFTYRMALGERHPVVEPIQFEPVTCDVLVKSLESGFEKTCTLEEYEHSISPILSDFRTTDSWGRRVIDAAIKELNHRRENGAVDAGGICWADGKDDADQWHAQFANRGEKAVLAYSDLDDGKQALRDFKVDTSIKWLVCVKQASEGYDAPRAEVGIHANTQQTALVFHQEFGRLVRTRKGAPRRTAKLFIPQIETLVNLAKAVEDDIQIAIREREELVAREPSERATSLFSFSVRSDEAKPTGVIIGGTELPSGEVSAYREMLTEHGFGDVAHRSPELMLLLQRSKTEPVSAVEVEEDFDEVRKEAAQLQRTLMGRAWKALSPMQRGQKVNEMKERHGIPRVPPEDMTDAQIVDWRDALRMEVYR